MARRPPHKPARRLRNSPFAVGLVAARLYAGVFCLFAPVGLLIAMCQTEPWGWGAGLLSAAFSGSISLGWVYAVNSRKYWMFAPLAIGPPVIAPFLFSGAQAIGLYNIGDDHSRAVRMVILAALVTVFISVGFFLVIRYVQMHETKAAKDRAELDVAQKIHETLVPPIDLRWNTARVLAQSRASARMGGDLIDALARDGQLDLVMADVSGHGVGAGVVMAMVKSAMRARLNEDRAVSLVDLLASVNAVICATVTDGMFVTLTCVRLRPNGECEIASAGHLPTLIRRDDGAIESVDNESLPIGVLASEEFACAKVRLGRGDRLMLYTDGLTETADTGNEFFGIVGMRNALAATGRSGLDESFHAILRRVAEHGPIRDDQSLLLLEIGAV